MAEDACGVEQCNVGAVDAGSRNSKNTTGGAAQDFEPNGMQADRARGTVQARPVDEVLASPYITPSVTEEGPPIQKSVTLDLVSDAFAMPSAKRVRTAPTRRTMTRASTWGGRKWENGTTTAYSSDHGAFNYSFGTGGLDSDDSSSSSEDEEPAPAADDDAAEKDEGPTGGAYGGYEADDSQERRRFFISNDYFRTKGRVSKKDGRLKISINDTANSGYIAKALGQSIRNHLDLPRRDRKTDDNTHRKKRHDHHEEVPLQTKYPPPRLNIVIMVIGSRGDITPFLQIGKLLMEARGHRVRIATHPAFQEFVEKTGLEFFSVGGDPSELMAFMVRNPGLIPGLQTLREGEIGRRRAAMGAMFEGFWQACIADSEPSDPLKKASPFIADAIIANPPSMAHVHVAERLGIPLHIMFTFPYTPTTQFPHPLANIKMRKSNVDAGYVNFMSYPLVEMMTWQGLGDIVNRFRENTLRLEPVSSLWAPGALYRMKVAYTYLWSPSLVPKPKDWGPEIDIAGFVFLNLRQYFEPPDDLVAFLNAGEPPVYIGFGSIVVDDPNGFTEMILKAVKLAGVRALISKGWGGLGRGNEDTPQDVFMLGNIPHDWLFPQVKAVVHHGGAGTTAIGLKCARPTMIVPFFGDQSWWGAMVAEARAGAFECIPYKRLTVERLAEGIRQCLTEEAQNNVRKIADSIEKDGDGAANAVTSFIRSLPMAGRHNMRCSILQERVAVWKVKKSSLRLSALAAQLLHEQDKVKWSELKLIRHYAWNDFDGPGEPLSGGLGALTESLYGIGEGFGMVPIRIARHIRVREEHERKRRDRKKRRKERERLKTEQREAPSSPVKGVRPGPIKQDTDTTLHSAASSDPVEPLSREIIDDLGYGLKRAGAAALSMPNDLSFAIAQGIHNAPRLWGDATVRKPTKISNVKSGLTAARKEFVYGIYDGWTGLVTQPKGDWEDGETFASKVTGLGTGVGKGVGGFVFKNLSALWAPPTFLVRGVIKHIENKSDGPGSKPFIRRSRILQGEDELHALRQRNHDGAISGDKSEDVQDLTDRVLHGWEVYQDIWRAAEQTFGPFGPLAGNLLGRYKMRREKERWDINGALENVDVAKQTLKASQQGHDLEDLFAQRREEMRIAEQPRASVLEHPATAEEAGDGALQSDNAEDGDDSKDGTSEPPKRSREDIGETMAARTAPFENHLVETSPPMDATPRLAQHRSAVTVV